MKLPRLCFRRLTCLVLLGASTAWAIDPEDPVWKQHVIDARTEDARGADGVRLADVNGDGLLDIASGWEEARQTRVYLHPGKAQVQDLWPKVIVGKGFGAPEDAVFCDLDADGAVDVISSSEGGKVHVHWAPKNPEDYLKKDAWTTEPFLAGMKHGGMFIVPLQLDGQHGVDLVSGGKGKDLAWYQGPEEPRDLEAWTRHVISSRCKDGWTMGIYSADIDADGDPDLVWTSRKGENGGVRWMENPGPGPAQKDLWTEHKLSNGHADFMFGAVADVDADGRLDIVAPVRNAGVHLFLNLGGDEWDEVVIPATDAKKGAGLGDINLDGKLDIVLTHVRQGPVWYENSGNPSEVSSWVRHETKAGGGKSDLVALYDVDQDGDLDILTTVETKDYQVTWYENPFAKPASE